MMSILYGALLDDRGGCQAAAELRAGLQSYLVLIVLLPGKPCRELAVLAWPLVKCDSSPGNRLGILQL